MIGTLVGALILGMLDNVLGLKGVNSNLQLVVKGLSDHRCRIYAGG